MTPFRPPRDLVQPPVQIVTYRYTTRESRSSREMAVSRGTLRSPKNPGQVERSLTREKMLPATCSSTRLCVITELKWKVPHFRTGGRPAAPAEVARTIQRFWFNKGCEGALCGCRNKVYVEGIISCTIQLFLTEWNNFSGERECVLRF